MPGEGKKNKSGREKRETGREREGEGEPVSPM